MGIIAKDQAIRYRSATDPALAGLWGGQAAPEADRLRQMLNLYLV